MSVTEYGPARTEWKQFAQVVAVWSGLVLTLGTASMAGDKVTK